MPGFDSRDLRYIALMPLVTMLAAGVTSMLAGFVLLFELTPPLGPGACLGFDASMLAAVVAVVSGLVTAGCAIAHLNPRDEDRDTNPTGSAAS